MNLGATYKLSETMSVDLQLKNLTNRYYEYVWYDPDGADASLLRRVTVGPCMPGDLRFLKGICVLPGEWSVKPKCWRYNDHLHQLSGVGGSVPSSETAATAATPQNHSTRMLVRST